MKTPSVHRSSMINRPPKFWRGLSQRLFGYLSLDEVYQERIRNVAQEGQVIYIMRSRSLLDYLAYNYIFVNRELPLARFANGVNLSFFRGIREWVIDTYQNLMSRTSPLPDEGLRTQLSHGNAALVFLRERKWVATRRTSPIYFENLVAFQRQSEKPLFLVPQLIHWPPSPPSKQKSLMDILFGDVEEAGRLRKMVHFFRYSRKASLRVGEPINLKEFIQDCSGWSDARIARKLRRLLMIQLNREALSIHGPAVKSPDQLQYELLDRKRFKHEVKTYAEENEVSFESAQDQAKKYLKEIASRPKFMVIELFGRFLDFLFFKVFNGVEIDESDILRVKEAAKNSRNAPMILVPSHKSHVDYLVVSWVFLRNDFVPPHIAAGANLSFFPLGVLLRNAGAFFLRRSFVGLDLYKMVFKSYLWKLVREGYPIEFFIEGGRTRTGKLIMPKMGMLSMLLEGLRRGEYKDLQFVPINLSYERVVETASYRKELTGGEKESESVRGVLQARKVLRSRYGRIYVHFESPLLLSDYLKQNQLSEVSDQSVEFKSLTERVAFHIMYRIQEATVISPSALVGFILLSHERRGLQHDRLSSLIGFILKWADRRGARVSNSLKATLLRHQNEIQEADQEGLIEGFKVRGQSVAQLTDEALSLLKRLVDKVERSGQVIYVVPDKSRIELDYYRNSLLGLIAPEAIMCSVLASYREGTVWEVLRKETRWVSELFKLEFIYRNDQPFEEIIHEVLDHLKEVGIIEEKDGIYKVIMKEEAFTLSSSLRHLFECYWVAAHTLKATINAPIEGKKWVKSAREQADLAFLQGEIRRAEAASSVALANALQWFVRQGWVLEETSLEGNKRIKKYQIKSSDAFEVFFERLARILARLPESPPPQLSPLHYYQNHEEPHTQETLDPTPPSFVDDDQKIPLDLQADHQSEMPSESQPEIQPKIQPEMPNEDA